MTQTQVLQLFRAGSQYATSSRLALMNGSLVANFKSDNPFVLAQRIQGIGDESTAIIANGDNAGRLNREARQLQQDLFSEMADLPRVPFSALNLAGLPIHALQIVDFTTDDQGSWYAQDAEYGDDGEYEKSAISGYKANSDGVMIDSDGRTADQVIPDGALRTIVGRAFLVDKDDAETKGPDTDGSGRSGTEYIRAYNYHRVGTVVVRCNDKDYLCSMDEKQYFISLLPVQVDSVGGAFRALAPEEVQTYITATNSNPRRQGEWFFIPVPLDDSLTVPLSAMKGEVDMPRENELSNLHRASEGVEVDGVLYVRGEIVHWDANGENKSGEHADLFLGTQWHRVAKNTSVADWTVPQDSSREPSID